MSKSPRLPVVSKGAEMQEAHAEACEAPPVEQPKEPDTKEKAKPRRTAMTERCRLALQKSHRELMRDLDVQGTIDYLFSKMVLTLKDKQEIQGKPTEYEKRTKLLDLLPQRGQAAYDELCGCLSNDQSWLRDTLQKNHDTITEDDLVWFEQTRDQREDDFVSVEQTRDQKDDSVAVTAELVGQLRDNLREKMTEWKTALEQGFPDQEGLLPYIDQPYTLRKESSQKQSDVGSDFAGDQTGNMTPESRGSDVSRSIKLVEDSTPRERIIMYGGAGAGKTTLLKEIARSWIEKSNPILVEKFTFMFLIPLRFVGKASLLSIICDELKLVPTSNIDELKKSGDRNERGMLFLLDSYDELRQDVAQGDRSEIGDLITGRLFPTSTVVVTSRPGHEMGKSGHQKIAQLEDLPEDKVKEVIQKHIHEGQEAVDEILASFPAMSFLQKPINLALFLFITKKYKHLKPSQTQADLFSMILQSIMLACAKKKKLPEFIPQLGSFLANKKIHRDIRRLFKDLAKKCYDERAEMNGVLHFEDSDELEEYLDFGLFAKSSERNTVVLPHPLFQEYFAACYLAETPETWKALLKDLRQKSESQSPKALIDIVRPMGLENIVRFVVALSPQVCEELTNLFVVERKPIEGCDNYQLVNYDYYAELVRDCIDGNGKRILATAFLNAPVVNVTDTCSNTQGRTSTLLPYHLIDNLEYNQCVVTFLKKVYNLDLCRTGGQLSISCIGNDEKLEIRDGFLVALVHRYDCHINTHQLIIRGEDGRYLDLAASMLPSKVPAVVSLTLDKCMLRGNIPDTDKPMAPQHSSLPVGLLKQPSLERVILNLVSGLEHCDVIASRQCHLEMYNCGDVNVRTLRTCFPELSELKLKYGSVVAETGDELMSWLSTVRSVRALGLAHIEGESPSVSHQLNMWTERIELEYLGLSNYTLSFNERYRPTSFTINETLKEFQLWSCKEDVDLVRLFEVCSYCLLLKKLYVYSSQLMFQVGDSDTVKENNTLNELMLSECKGDVDLDGLLEVCSRCQQLTKLSVHTSQLVVRVRERSSSDTLKQNRTLCELWLVQCKGELDLGKVFEVCSRCLPVTELTVHKSEPVVRARDLSKTVTRNNTLRELQLHECIGDVDFSELFQACSQCPMLATLCLTRSQLAVRNKDSRDTIAPNNALSKLVLGFCKGDLSELLEACSLCLQLKEVWVFESNMVLDVEKIKSIKQLSGLQEFFLHESNVRTPAGQTLSTKELKETFSRLCPSADILIWG